MDGEEEGVRKSLKRRVGERHNISIEGRKNGKFFFFF
jgi:hypothetical protein